MKRLLVLILIVGSLVVVQPSMAASDCPLKGHPVGDGRWTRKQFLPLETRSVRIRFENGSTARMKAVRLGPGEFEIRLHWREKSEWFSPVDFGALAEKRGAAVILNAGYYDENGRPMGYFRSGGKVFNSRVLYRGRKTFLHYGAMFTVGRKNGRPGIVSREKFQKSSVTEAFQAGPLLVKDHKPVQGLSRYREYLRATRRTVVGLGRRGEARRSGERGRDARRLLVRASGVSRTARIEGRPRGSRRHELRRRFEFAVVGAGRY